MADIIDFPSSRIKRLVVLEAPRLTTDEQHTVVSYLRDYGFSAREAAKEALEAAQCR